MKILTNLLLIHIFLIGSLISAGAQKALLPFIVKITSEGPLGQEVGSGLVIGKANDIYYIVTAGHVIASQGQTHENIQVYFERKRLDGKVGSFKGIDEAKDIGLIEVSNAGYPELQRLAYVEDLALQLGDRIINIGHPSGQGWFINIQEEVNLPQNPRNTYEFGITNTALAPGSSGSPIFSRDNRWIGMVTETSSIVGTCVSASQIVAIVKDWGYPSNLVNPNIDPPAVDNINLVLDGKGGANMVPKSFKDEFVGEMVWVEGGTFALQRGVLEKKTPDADNEYKLYTQMIDLDGYYLGKYEVTQEIWSKVMGKNPSHFKGCDQCPVENVSPDEVFQFLFKLNKLTGLKFRLPTEAEWEFAARGGNSSRKTEFAGSDNLDMVASYKKNADKKPHPVGEKMHNELELYDLSGNVWEMCSDPFGELNFKNNAAKNPANLGDSVGPGNVARGEAWDFRHGRVLFDHLDPWGKGTARRYAWKKNKAIGFRLALSFEK